MTQRHTTPRSLALGALAFVLLAGGCASVEPATTEAPAVQTDSPATSSEPQEGSVDDEPTTDWTDGAPETGTDAFLAWEALMGPDGEYAALASYQAVIDTFGDVEPYVSIQQAEARHADALIRQLDRMGVEVPDNPYLGNVSAPADLQTAATAWAEGEVANVELYDTLMEQAQDDRLIRVFDNLRRASAEEHLPAFELAAENGGTLTPEQMMR